MRGVVRHRGWHRCGRGFRFASWPPHRTAQKLRLLVAWPEAFPPTLCCSFTPRQRRRRSGVSHRRSAYFRFTRNTWNPDFAGLYWALLCGALLCGTRLCGTRLDCARLRIALFLWALDRRGPFRHVFYRARLGAAVKGTFGGTGIWRTRITIAPILALRPILAIYPFWPICPYREIGPLRPICPFRTIRTLRPIGALEPVLPVIALPVLAIAEAMPLLALPLSIVLRPMRLLPVVLLPVILRVPVLRVPVLRVPVLRVPVLRVPVLVRTILIGAVVAARTVHLALVRKPRNRRLLGLTDVIACIVVAVIVAVKTPRLIVHAIVRRGSGQALLLAIGHDDADVMLGMLQIVLS